MSAIVNMDGITFDHPSVVAGLVKRNQGGYFPVDKVQKALMDAGVPDALIPKGPSLTTALHRAFKDACRGDSSREVKITGRKSSSVYTIVNINKQRLDRDTDDGKGVADAELTGRIEFDGAGGYTVKLTPADHPSGDYIRHRMDVHCGQFSNVLDLGTWLGHDLMPHVGCVPTGSGDYFIPKGAGLDLLMNVQKAFADMNSSGNYVKVYVLPQVNGVDMVDIITDCLLDECERVCSGIEERLDDPQNPVKRRGLTTLSAEANKLRDIVEKFQQSCSISADDVFSRITDVEAAIGIAESALS